MRSCGCLASVTAVLVWGAGIGVPITNVMSNPSLFWCAFTCRRVLVHVKRRTAVLHPQMVVQPALRTHASSWLLQNVCSNTVSHNVSACRAEASCQHIEDP